VQLLEVWPRVALEAPLRGWDPSDAEASVVPFADFNVLYWGSILLSSGTVSASLVFREGESVVSSEDKAKSIIHNYDRSETSNSDLH